MAIREDPAGGEGRQCKMRSALPRPGRTGGSLYLTDVLGLSVDKLNNKVKENIRYFRK